MMEVVSGDNWSYKTCKAPVQIITNKSTPCIFTGRMPFLSPKAADITKLSLLNKDWVTPILHAEYDSAAT